MHQLWAPEWLPGRLSRQFLDRCLRTTAGGQFEKLHYLALALHAATREGVVDEGEFIIRNDALARMLEHGARWDTLRRKLAALQREALIDVGRTGRASRYRIFARPDDRIVLATAGGGRSLEKSAPGSLEEQIRYAISHAQTGHWKPKTLLMALGALWVVMGNEQGSMRIRRAELRSALEWGHQSRLDSAKRSLRDAGYIDWIRLRHEIEMRFLVDSDGRPRPELLEGEGVTLEVAGTAGGSMAPEDRADTGAERSGGQALIDAPPDEEREVVAQASAGGVPRMTSRQLRTLAGILRDLYGIPVGQPVEKITLAALPEDLAAEINRRRSGRKPTAGASGELSLEAIPADIGAELIGRLGGPARTESDRRRRTRWLRQRARESRDADTGRREQAAGGNPACEHDGAGDNTRQERAEDTARQLGFVPTDDPDEPWIRRSEAGARGYRIVGGRAVKPGRSGSGERGE